MPLSFCRHGGGIQHVYIKRSGSQPSGKGPAEYFTGTVRIDPLFEAPDPARVSGASVTFEPGARTAWHTHPLGQTLIVTAGSGRVQRLTFSHTFLVKDQKKSREKIEPLNGRLRARFGCRAIRATGCSSPVAHRLCVPNSPQSGQSCAI